MYIYNIFIFICTYIYILLNFFNEWIMMREVIGLWHFCVWTRNIWDVLARDYSPLCSNCVVPLCWFRQRPACRVFWRFANSHKSNLIGLILIQSLSILSLKFNSRAIIQEPGSSLVKHQIALHISACLSWVALVVLLGRGILKALMRLLRNWRCVVRSFGLRVDSHLLHVCQRPSQK